MKFINAPLEKHLGDEEYIERVLGSIDELENKAKNHVKMMHFYESDSINVFSNCFLPRTHPDYEHPSSEIVSAVVDLIVSRGYTATDISRELGVTTDRNRTLKYWCSPTSDRKIPYAAWVYLCAMAGLMLPTMLPIKTKN
ncbi:hypothetical protein [Vibrio parahaemolyticus]|uniref:hypothetical protein n=1 Tax=Vibrio parahaemolyticus TaxID=670 RepID=UPI00226B321A|nr:hypothetical protein [Vibrio parahaemolyticus]MCX8941251.1 hypothetical protein [Vibrio parahaemolyticus]